MRLNKRHDLDHAADCRRKELEKIHGCRVYTFKAQPRIQYCRSNGDVPFALLDSTPERFKIWCGIPVEEVAAHADATDRIVYGE